MNNGLYIYGIINSGTHELKGSGWKEGAPVYLVSYQDMAAVVSDEEIVDLARLTKDLVARRVVDHQRVIEGVMSLKHTIIPI